jgi:signal transduction histidine kinase
LLIAGLALGVLNAVMLVFPKSLVGGVSTAVIASLFDAFTLVMLGLYYQQRILAERLHANVWGLVAVGAFLYALVQPLYIAQIIYPAQEHVIDTIGFFGGFLAKGMIAAGYLRIFVTVSSRAERDRARFVEAKHIVQRIKHELGTPISEIGLLVGSMTRSAPAHGRFRENVLDLENAVLRVQAILDAVHDVVLLAAGGKARTEIEQVAGDSVDVFNINAVVQRAVIAVKSTRTEPIKWRITYSANSCVRCNSSQLVQLFINLFRNAHDAIGNTQGIVVIETRKRLLEDIVNEDREAAARTLRSFDYGPPGAEQVEILVRDDGEGIPVEIASRIFEEGFSTRGGRGRGHGLAIVQQVARQHSGSIRLRHSSGSEDEACRGTEVVVRFPRVPCKPGGK